MPTQRAVEKETTLNDARYCAVQRSECSGSVDVIGKTNVVPKPMWRIVFGWMGLHVNNATSCVIVLHNANLLFQRVLCTDIAMGTDVA